MPSLSKRPSMEDMASRSPPPPRGRRRASFKRHFKSLSSTCLLLLFLLTYSTIVNIRLWDGPFLADPNSGKDLDVPSVRRSNSNDDNNDEKFEADIKLTAPVKPKPKKRGFLEFDFDSKSRADRFPTVEERVRLYAGNWYLPPCENSSDGKFVYKYTKHLKKDRLLLEYNSMLKQHPNSVLKVNTEIEYDTLFYMKLDKVLQCTNKRANVRFYCSDVVQDLLPLLEENWEKQAPFLFQFGDSIASRRFGYVDVPHIKKHRFVADHKRLQNAAVGTSGDKTCIDKPSRRTSIVESVPAYRPENTVALQNYQPVLWKLVSHKHYESILSKIDYDIPWHNKINKAVFWGAPTGVLPDARVQSEEENCLRNHRCRFVYKNALRNSTLVDAKLLFQGQGKFAHEINGVEIYADPTTDHGNKKDVEELLQYKALIKLEGNDVATGLKWALYSNSVVLMPPPTRTTWAMEELLVPWVHYVPIDDPNYDDVDAKMRWIIENDEEAQRISRYARQWIEDLLFHEDAEQDDIEVNKEVLKRYTAHFAPATDSVKS